MSHSDQDIPTLTDFIRTGDEDMYHHFDAHQFSIDEEDNWAATDIDASHNDAFSADALSKVELANDEIGSEDPADSDPFTDPLQIAAVEIDQVPAELAPFDPALVEDDTATDETDEYLELDVQEVTSPSTRIPVDETEQQAASTLATTRQQIDQAVDELLPDIAEQLKQNLYRHFKCQRDSN